MLNYSSLKKLLLDTDSDKQSMHRYGFIYDLLFNSVALKKQDKLNILEIGVSKFGDGSLHAWQNSGIVKRCVGIDTMEYQGVLNDKAVFYKLDAYNSDTIDHLKEIEGILFDIIIDDGTHKAPDQSWFLDHYTELLSEHGYLICEDVSSLELIVEQCESENVFCVDGWGNRGIQVKSYNKDPNLYMHDERLLIKSKSEPIADSKKHEYKKHILRLPDFECEKYDRHSTELAVSVPLFHSELDTQYAKFDIERFQEVHCRGAIWAAMSLIKNSDLGDNGTPLYFHIEDKAWDYALPVFKKFKVPQDWLRKVSVPTVEHEYKINKTHFGKKYIPLLDDGIDSEVLLILDSDAFTCCNKDQLKLYDKLTSDLLKKQPAMTHFQLKYLPYWWWMGMISLASGMPEKTIHKKPLADLEVEIHKRLGFNKVKDNTTNPKAKVPRFFAENYMITFPRGHQVRDYVINNIPTCYTSPYLLSVWAEHNYQFINLTSFLDLPVYDWEKDFVKGQQGYDCLAHIRVDKVQNPNMSKPSLVNIYWDKFFEVVSKHVLS